MGIFDGCLLVSDFDGTLYHSPVVPKENIEAIEWFKAEGGKFTVATGRGPYAARKVFRLVSVNAPALLTNGSVLFDAQKRSIVEAVYLSGAVKEKTREVIEKFPDIGVEITLSESIITISENEDTIAHRNSESFADVLSSYEEIKELPWIKTLIMTSNEELMNRVKAFLNEEKPEDCEYIITNPIFYEILPKGINKACKLDRLMEITNCQKLFCIGDYYNDLEMVLKADIGAFAENSPQELKLQADYIAGTVQKGAVADFINYLGENLKNI